MLHITTEELHELHFCLAKLDGVLERLDRIGAGIAAIHVDAAIHHLRDNLDAVEQGGPCRPGEDRRRGNSSAARAARRLVH
ncbi:hypothetical protein [Erythrobacter sp.]|uniref:hypothetical protein n=1 Tax=Erythrobacter sp. TaxID=1042 RepID=UPI002EBA2EFD|nr:hypothetical protein [Erythrobacter sp.]